MEHTYESKLADTFFVMWASASYNMAHEPFMDSLEVVYMLDTAKRESLPAGIEYPAPFRPASTNWDLAVLEPIGERAYRTPCQGCFIFKCGPYTNKCFGCDPTQADYPY